MRVPWRRRSPWAPAWIRTAALLALAPAALWCACQPPPEPVAAPPARHTPRPQRLVTAAVSDPKTFNPILVTDSASGLVLADVFEGLVRLNPLRTEIEPLLAERWERDPDGTVWTFFLRRDVRWHDGVPFTAADVVTTFGAVFSDAVPNSAKHILTVDGAPLGVEAVDAHTVRFRLPRPFAPLLNAIGVSIVPAHVLGASLADGTFAQQWGIDTPPDRLIGTGPYRLAKYVPAQYVQFRRNPDYWMKDADGGRLPALEERTVLIVPNQDAMYLKFSAGQTDVHVPRPEEVVALRREAAALGAQVVETGLDTGSLFVSFNRNPNHYSRDGHRDPRLTWFADKHFVRAIAHAIDKQSIIQNCLFGFGRPAVSEISPENAVFHHPALTDYAYDLDEARRLLAEGGYVDRDGDGVIEDSGGNPVEFTLTTNVENQVRQKVCSMLKEDWTRLGMRVHYRPLEFTTLVEKLDTTLDWDAVLIGFTGSVEPHNGANILRSSSNLHLWHPRQQRPATAWEREIDELVEAGARQLNRGARVRIYWRIQEILHEELPMIQTVRETRFVAVRDYVQRYQPTVWGLYQPERIAIAE